MDYRLTRNPLLQTVIYKRFHHVANGLGFDPVQTGMIPNELCAYLRQEIETISDQNDMAKDSILKGIKDGEVVAIEMLSDGNSSLLVRCPIEKHLVDLRMIYKSGVWEVAGVASIHTRPLYKNPNFTKLTVTAACLLFLVGGIVIGSAFPKHIDIKQYAKDNGFVVMTVAEEQKLVNDQTPGSIKGYSSTLTASRGSSLTTKAPSASSVTFSLQQGMGTQDLTDFLVNSHLIKDGVEFNQKMIDSQIDRSIKPGTYTFTTNSTEDQILQTIKQGPQS